jgi:hypothetical protein
MLSHGEPVRVFYPQLDAIDLPLRFGIPLPKMKGFERGVVPGSLCAFRSACSELNSHRRRPFSSQSVFVVQKSFCPSKKE